MTTTPKIATILALAALALIAAGCGKDAAQSFTDERDGKTYRTVTIGKQTWMAENLNFATDKSACYDDADSNCVKYGRRYYWDDAMAACPATWRLPASEDWEILALAAGGKRRGFGYGFDGATWKYAGRKLKSKTGWADWWGIITLRAGSEDEDWLDINWLTGVWSIVFHKPVSGNGTDKFGFSALPGGPVNSYNNYTSAGEAGDWWSATEHDESSAGFWYMRSDNSSIVNDYYRKRSRFSVRCLKGSAAPREYVAPDTSGGSFTDSRDGKTYRTVKIGKFTWMAENLNFATDKSVCYNNADSNCAKYGRLYNWHDAMAACPATWRVPGDEDWDSLAMLAGGRYWNQSRVWTFSAKKLKSATGWADRETDGDSDAVSGNGTDDFGFSALPGGSGGYADASFDRAGKSGNWWSAEDSSAGRAWARYMSYGASYITRFTEYKDDLHSVRCLMGSAADTVQTTVAGKHSSDQFNPDIAYGSLVYGGQSYRTVKIGNLTWMAENLNFETGASSCYDNNERNCQRYGRLYTWYDAMIACPPGWRVPTAEDWDNLAMAAGGRRVGDFEWAIAGKKLKSKTGWYYNNGYNIGTDDFGFSALPGGFFWSYGDKFINAGYSGNWWSAEYGTSSARNFKIINTSAVWDGHEKAPRLSVRCVTDSSTKGE